MGSRQRPLHQHRRRRRRAAEPAQGKGSLLGKILRISPLRRRGPGPYSIPNDNPYVGEPGRDEIFARGLRNPWRFSFAGHKIVIGDVGQDRFEEVDYERLGKARGANFGWDNYEGNAIFEGPALSNHDRPIHTYSHSGGRCSITGGYVVRDADLGPLKGRYVYGDLCTGQIRSLKPRLGGARRDRPPASSAAAWSRSALTLATTSTSSRAAASSGSYGTRAATGPARSLTEFIRGIEGPLRLGVQHRRRINAKEDQR